MPTPTSPLSRLRWLALSCVLPLTIIAGTDLLRRRLSVGLAAVVVVAGVALAWRERSFRSVRVRAAVAFGLTLLAAAYPAFSSGVASPLYEAAPALVTVLAAWSTVLWLPPPDPSKGVAEALDVWEREFEDRQVARWVPLAAMAITGAALGVLHELIVRDYRFSTSDETFYLVQSGWVWLPGFGLRVDPDLHPFFRSPFAFFSGDRLVTQYPPGWPVVLALFSRLGAGEWSGAILGGASVGLTYALGRRLHGVLPGALAAALLATHSWFYQTHIGLLSHPLTMFAVTAAAWLVVARDDLTGSRAAAAYVAAGALLALAVATRPLTGVALALTVEGWRILRSRARWRGVGHAWPWYAVGGAPVIAALLAYNAATTGHPLVFGYQATHGTLHAVGFGERGYVLMTGGTETRLFTPTTAVENLLARTGEIVLHVPGLALLLPVLLVGMAYGYRVRAATVATFLTLPVAHFFFFGSHWRFYTELLPFLFIGAGAVVGHVARANARGGAVLAVAGLVGNLFFPPQTDLLRFRTGENVAEGIRALERMGRERRLLAILPRLRDDGGRAFPLFALNRAGENSNVIVVPNTDRDLSPLLAHFADRTPVRVRWDAAGTRLEFREMNADTARRGGSRR